MRRVECLKDTCILIHVSQNVSTSMGAFIRIRRLSNLITILNRFPNRLQRGRGAAWRAGQSDYPGTEEIILPTFPSATGGQFSAGQEASAWMGLRISGHRYPTKSLGPAERRTFVLRRCRGCSLRQRGKCTTALCGPYGGHHVYGGTYCTVTIVDDLNSCNFVTSKDHFTVSVSNREACILTQSQFWQSWICLFRKWF